MSSTTGRHWAIAEYQVVLHVNSKELRKFPKGKLKIFPDLKLKTGKTGEA